MQLLSPKVSELIKADTIAAHIPFSSNEQRYHLSFTCQAQTPAPGICIKLTTAARLTIGKDS